MYRYMFLCFVFLSSVLAVLDVIIVEYKKPILSQIFFYDYAYHCNYI